MHDQTLLDVVDCINTTGWAFFEMHCRVLTTDDTGAWHQVLSRIPKTDIYFLPEYHRLYEQNGDGSARLFIAEDGDRVYVHPFLLRPISEVAGQPLREPLYDASSVYGYEGPLSSTDDAAFNEAGSRMLGTWFRDNNVITEFVRFNPLLDNYRLVDADYTVQMNRETVAVPLSEDGEATNKAASPEHRNRVRKALKEGLECRELPGQAGLDVFIPLYVRTMDMLQAQQLYYFSEVYFKMLLELGSAVRIFAVFKDDVPIASALFMFHGDVVHYHLGGSDPEQRRYAPNNLLFHTVAITGGKEGYRWLHMGGGRTAHPQDSLLVFKTQLSRERLSYYLGQRVLNPEIYQKLCDLWVQQKAAEALPPFFPAYRAP
jgi:hypothetical protein